MALRELGASLLECYKVQGNIKDLNRAIELHEKIFVFFPESDEEHGVISHNLALCLSALYNKLINQTDLNRAIDLQEKYLELHPQDHSAHGIFLWALGATLKKCYMKTESYSDLVRAIHLWKNALNIYPVQYHHFAAVASGLAATMIFAFKSSQSCLTSEQPPSLDETFQIYRLLKRYSPPVSLDLWDATEEMDMGC